MQSTLNDLTRITSLLDGTGNGECTSLEGTNTLKESLAHTKRILDVLKGTPRLLDKEKVASPYRECMAVTANLSDRVDKTCAAFQVMDSAVRLSDDFDVLQKKDRVGDAELADAQKRCDTLLARLQRLELAVIGKCAA